MVLPMTEYDNIVASLNDHLRSGQWSKETSDAFTVQASRIRDKDIGEGDMVLGMIHAMNKNISGMRKRFNNALAFGHNKDDVFANYGRALFFNGCFSEAIEKLLAVEGEDKSCYYVIALCCLALGLDSKARQYYILSGEKASFEHFCTQTKLPKSNIKKGFEAVRKSMKENPDIWKSLSQR